MEYAVEMLNITKVFPGIIANDDVTLRVEKGEIHALLGENGAGKSTLMSVLFGAYKPEKGTIRIYGKDVNIVNSNTATDLGIGMVHQHFKLVHNYTVTENIVLGIEGSTSAGFLGEMLKSESAVKRICGKVLKNVMPLDFDLARDKIRRLCKQYGFNLDPDDLIENISVGQQQKVEILKTLYRDADIIIFDEPSAVLTPQEIDELLKIILKLKSEGKTIILITHKLKEIKAVADRCTILRRGKYVDCVDVKQTSEDELASLMVGRAVKFNIDKGISKPADVVFEMRNVSSNNDLGVEKIHDFSLSIRRGEIVGIAGVDGNGQSELLATILGLYPVKKGEMYLKGELINDKSIRERIEMGLGCVPEDRKKHGFVAEFDISMNSIIKDYYRRFSDKVGILDVEASDRRAASLIDQFDIRCGQGVRSEVGSLSGGNQQKVIIAREINLKPDFIIFSQPTRGLDVGAIEVIRKRIIQERDRGAGIMLISFELAEIMNLCDRIAAISKGTINGIKNADETNESEIGLLMAGKKAE
ncbi:MAG TPA: heme ABC transporter ATP-binding protein [Spirochaetaceae bacterium]|nr:heme ABC transporter ATP-binding protein [Spirochaetaceae bacterium]